MDFARLERVTGGCPAWTFAVIAAAHVGR